LMDHLKRIENGEIVATVKTDSDTDTEESVHQIKNVDDVPVSNETLIEEANRLAKEILLNSSDSNEKEAVIDSDDSINNDDKDETPLHWACLNGGTEAVRLLLQAGANPNQLSTDGKTGLHYSVINKHAGVIALMLSDPRMDAKFRKEARDIAVHGGEKVIIQLFDPEKREMLVVAQDHQRAIDEYRQRINVYEQRRDADQKAIDIAQKKLAAEAEAHKIDKALLEQLQEEIQSRSISEHEQRYSDFRKEMSDLSEQNEILRQQIVTLSAVPSLDPQVTESTVVIAYKTLSSLVALFNATNLAMNNSVTEVEALYKYIPLTQHQKTDTEDKMEY